VVARCFLCGFAAEVQVKAWVQPLQLYVHPICLSRIAEFFAEVPMDTHYARVVACSNQLATPSARLLAKAQLVGGSSAPDISVQVRSSSFVQLDAVLAMIC
jgi:hypothetical protein